MISATSGTNRATNRATSPSGASASGANRATVRCAIYTRKSTEEGLEQDFNSLDAQRAACEAFIESQRGEGWVLVPDRFDDGGFTGANIERPALKRLMAKVQAKEIDTVVLYKLDRLTRSIRDFGRIMDVFEGCGAGIVSVTQQMNTTTSMGRLMLHVLLSFAQFEREMTSERTRDKIRAARKSGHWTGGNPPLGYDLKEGKLIVNESEADELREIFRLYIEKQSIVRTVEELNRRGWRTKRWVSKENVERGGTTWSKAALRRVLATPVYLGMMPLGKEAFPSDHTPILDQATFDKAQDVLRTGRDHGPAGTCNSFAYLLRGLVHCAVCGSAMSAATTKKKGASYRYYRCTVVDKQGTTACPVRYAPAEPLEQFVIDHLRRLGREPELVEETLKQAQEQINESLARLGAERKRLESDSRRVQAEARQVMKATGSLATAHLADLEEQQGRIASRLAEIEEEAQKLTEAKIEPEQAKEALALFDPVWDALESQGRERLLRIVVQQVKYDGSTGEIDLAFHPLGLSQVARDATVSSSRDAAHRAREPRSEEYVA